MGKMEKTPNFRLGVIIFIIRPVWTGFNNRVAGGENAPGSSVTLCLILNLSIMDEQILQALESNQGHANAVYEDN
jgi:hypothetical protein